MLALEWLIRLLILLLLGTVGTFYWRGWRRLRKAGFDLAKPRRVSYLVASMVSVLLATFPPIYLLSHELLYARASQKILMAMLAAPLFWLSCPVHVVVWGLAPPWRNRIWSALQPSTRSGRALRTLTGTGTAWLVYVSAIVIWHDAGVVNWSMAGVNRHYITLGLMLGAALLYWVHIVGTGLRLRQALPGWVLFAYAVGVEIPNMAAGITIAYSGSPLYSHYLATHERLGVNTLLDQTVAGGSVWFMGSVVFFFSAVMVVNRLFLRHGSDSPEHYPEWDSDERMIAPGLEHRVKKKD